MAKNIELLLTENVEGTGIVGDVVKVRKGFARNYLMPRSMATKPSEELIKSLAGKRADALKQIEVQRAERKETISKLDGYQLTLIRSCNDMGILYAAVTQHDIVVALTAAGFNGIKEREVRLGQTVKRVEHYELSVKFDAELEATIKLDVQADRPLDLRRNEPTAPAAGEGGAEGAEGAVPSEKRTKDRTAKAAKEDNEPKAKAGTFEKRTPASDAPKSDAAEKPAKGEKKSKK
ncbi:MAG: 50S ribosomal protein L9 [Phycisphaerales bacterium]|nr:50S ribosomal protein L9 [Phycisphaerales bacterium]